MVRPPVSGDLCSALICIGYMTTTKRREFVNFLQNSTEINRNRALNVTKWIL
jgi:hypothetical protein